MAQTDQQQVDRARRFLQKHGLRDVPYNEDSVDLVELVMECREPELWRFAAWFCAKAKQARDGEYDRGAGSPTPCALLTNPSAVVTTLVAILRTIRTRFAEASRAGFDLAVRVVSRERLLKRSSN